MDQTRASALAAYQDLFERLWDCAFLIDKESFAVLDANPACERVLGISREALIGSSLPDWVVADQREEMTKSLRIARRRYYPRQFDSEWSADSSKKILMRVEACVLKLSDDSEVLQVVAKDVTREREIERQAEKYLQELRAANAKLEELSIKDELTGLYNIRHFKAELAKEHERSERYGTPYALVFIDVDHFKKYNDRNGHPAGDEVLRRMGAILREQVRNTDLPVRYGGEEFVVLCAGVNAQSARVLAERLQKAVASHAFPYRESQPLGAVTASIGVASFPQDGRSLDEVLKRADEALYASKENGRNQVTCFSTTVQSKRRKAA